MIEPKRIEQMQKLMTFTIVSVSSYDSTGEVYEWDDPKNAQSVLANCQKILSPFGVNVLGIRPVPGTTLERHEAGGMSWDIARIVRGTYYLPDSVFSRLEELEQNRIFFKYYIWMEEVTYSPLQGREISLFVPNQESTSLKFVKIPEPVIEKSRIDPILVGVMPTAPNKGVWCIVGKWFHTFDLMRQR